MAGVRPEWGRCRTTVCRIPQAWACQERWSWNRLRCHDLTELVRLRQNDPVRSLRRVPIANCQDHTRWLRGCSLQFREDVRIRWLRVPSNLPPLLREVGSAAGSLVVREDFRVERSGCFPRVFRRSGVG